MVCGDQCVDVSTVIRWVRWSVQWGNGLWWSVCWCEYSNTLGKVKCAVRKLFQKQNTKFFKDGFQKLAQPWRQCIEVLVILWKNNYAALKRSDVAIFLFCFIKISFPVHFLFKWKQNVSAGPRYFIDIHIKVRTNLHQFSRNSQRCISLIPILSTIGQ